jgi:hypothetical protein
MNDFTGSATLATTYKVKNNGIYIVQVGYQRSLRSLRCLAYLAFVSNCFRLFLVIILGSFQLHACSMKSSAAVKFVSISLNLNSVM